MARVSIACQPTITMKKAPTTTALSLPTIQAVQPKPTKKEIIDAMIVRAKVKHDEENARREAARDKIMKKIEPLVVKAIKSSAPKIRIYTYSQGDDRNHCDVAFSQVKSPELSVLFDQYSDLHRLSWDERDVRQSIQTALTGAAPQRILDNPEAVAAIDATLKQWGI